METEEAEKAEQDWVSVGLALGHERSTDLPAEWLAGGTSFKGSVSLVGQSLTTHYTSEPCKIM